MKKNNWTWGTITYNLIVGEVVGERIRFYGGPKDIGHNSGIDYGDEEVTYYLEPNRPPRLWSRVVRKMTPSGDSKTTYYDYKGRNGQLVESSVVYVDRTSFKAYTISKDKYN